MKGNRIVGTGRGLPAKVLTNNDLARMVDTTDEWIRTRTGIRQRHVASGLETTSGYCIEAALGAMAMADVSAKEIDLIIVATLTPDRLIPSTACIVQGGIGAVNAGCLDIEAACSGFVYGLAIADGMMPDQGIRTALVIGAESLSRIMDWSDRNTCVLFGDGAGAALLRHEGGQRGVLSTYLKADGSVPPSVLCVEPPVIDPSAEGRHERDAFRILMAGKEVFKFGVSALPDAIRGALERTDGLGIEDLDLIIPHQANVRIIEAAAKALGLPIEKFLVNVDRYGNTSAATIPIAMDEANREGRFKPGDLLALAGFGAGLTWGGAIVRW